MVASIAYFDHMASFGDLTFHLLAHEFVASLHLATIAWVFINIAFALRAYSLIGFIILLSVHIFL